VNAVPGPEETQSAYRSELAGVSGSLAILASVCSLYQISSGTATLGLDGDQALKAASGHWPLDASQPDFDLLCDIRKKIELLPIHLEWQWIEGHQDDDIPFEDLDQLSKDNVLADSLAKAFLNELISTDYAPAIQRFGDEGWSVKFQGNKLARVDVSALYKALYAPTTEQYWMRKHQLPRALIRSIDWDICGESYRQLRFHQKRRISKQATGHLAVGTMMKRWGFQDNDECPRCQEPAERAIHVFLCQDERAEIVWQTALLKLDKWMLSQHTMPQLRTALLACLSHWRDPVLPCPPSDIHDIRMAVELQDRIGWYPFVNGHLCNLWKGIQHQYYVFLGRRNTGRKWVRELIKKLWGIAWDMWEHRNGILHADITPAKLQQIEQANLRVQNEFDTGPGGLMARDTHWVLQDIGTILRYDLETKLQWLESVALSRARHAARSELTYAAMQNQRDLMERWLSNGS
jgi:hypothetical protein